MARRPTPTDRPHQPLGRLTMSLKNRFVVVCSDDFEVLGAFDSFGEAQKFKGLHKGKRYPLTIFDTTSAGCPEGVRKAAVTFSSPRLNALTIDQLMAHCRVNKDRGQELRAEWEAVKKERGALLTELRIRGLNIVGTFWDDKSEDSV